MLDLEEGRIGPRGQLVERLVDGQRRQPDADADPDLGAKRLPDQLEAASDLVEIGSAQAAHELVIMIALYPGARVNG